MASFSAAGPAGEHDYDYLVIGSGFGGSVSALRLAEKGYRVGLLECGRRFADEDFAETTWDMRRYFWAPKLGLRGIMRLTTFKDIFIVSGNGVGGGSLGYANTLYRARDAFYEHEQWREPGRRLGSGTGAALRDRRADARRHHLRPPRPRRRDAARLRGRDRRRRDLQADPGRRLPRRAGQAGCRPLLRRRGARAARLHPLRQLHGRLPARRQEHAAEELPLVRGEARRRDPPRAPGDRDRAARGRRRLARLRGAQRALRAPGCASDARPTRPRPW